MSNIKTTVPRAIKVISIFLIISAILSFLAIGTAETGFGAIFQLIYSIWAIVLGINLLKLKDWAKNSTIIFCISLIIFYILLLFISGQIIYLFEILIPAAILFDLSNTKYEFIKITAKKAKKKKFNFKWLFWLIIMIVGGFILALIIITLLVGLGT